MRSLINLLAAWPLLGEPAVLSPTEAAVISENLYYGPADAVEIVVELLIDEGVLSAKMAAAGVAVRRHARYGSVCVMDFATLLRPRLQGRGGG